jgi:hypothetical protein
VKKIALLFSLLLAVPLGLQAQESFALANSSTGTTVSHLAKVVVNAGVPQAQITATTDTSGAVGIVAPDPNSGAGTSGQVVITRSGIVPCVFDNTTVAGDFVQIASGTAGDCHDVGATRPTSGQIIGVVIQQGGAAGTYNVLLDKSIFPASASSPSLALLGSSDTISAAGTFATTGSLGAPASVGSYIVIDVVGIYTTTATAAPLMNMQINALGTTGICPQIGNISMSTSQTAGPWNLHCVIQIATLGAPGTAWASGHDMTSGTNGGSPLFKLLGNGATASATTTSAQTVSVQETATMVAGQTFTLQAIKAYVINP